MAGSFHVKSLTPVLYVERIEPCLELWVDRLAFAVTASVLEGDHLGFVSLGRDGVELMYQTHQSLAADMATVGSMKGPTLLYLQVSDLNTVIAAIDPATVVVPRRKTFYGADEFFIRAAGGHIVGFAAFEEPTKTEEATA